MFLIMSKIWNNRLKDLSPFKLSFHYYFSQQKVLVWVFCFLSGFFSLNNPSPLSNEMNISSSENMADSSTSIDLDNNCLLLFWLIAFALTYTIYLPQVVQAFFSILPLVCSFKTYILVLKNVSNVNYHIQLCEIFNIHSVPQHKMTVLCGKI